MHISPAQKVDAFFSQYPVRRFSKRHILIFAEDKIEKIYFLREGLVKQYGISHRGDEIILNLFKENAFFPMSHVMNETVSDYIFEAETDIEVHIAPKDDVLRFIQDEPDVMYDLLKRVYKGTDGLLGRLTQLMSGSARTRLIYEIILEAQRFGTKGTGGSYTVHLMEKDLGSRSGLTRETVNREIHKLKQEKLISIERSVMAIPDIDALTQQLT